MDSRSYFTAETHPESVRPAETWLPSRFEAETAARLAYQDQFSVGRAIHQNFVEAEAQPFEWTEREDEVFTPERFGNEAKAYRAFWKYILGGLKESSAVQHFRQVKGEVESKSEIVDVFRALERTVARAFEKVPLSEQQRNRFREVWTNRDFSLMGRAVELADQVATAKAEGATFDADGNPSNQLELRHHPFEKFVIANPKLRPVDYWDSKDARGYLRRFGDLEVSEVAKGQIKRDLGDVQELDRAA